jgi:hypothetical protein
MNQIDIVHLIENNPITKLSGNYHNKLITKIKDKFNDNQQQIFVSSFYCYLNYDKKNDFIVDLDNIWKWLGFNQKVKAKILLENHFILNKDYTKSLSHTGKQNTHVKGGHNKETFLLNILLTPSTHILDTLYLLTVEMECLYGAHGVPGLLCSVI